MLTLSAKFALRMMFLTVFCALALIFVAGRAHADDVTTVTAPPAESAPAQTDSTLPPPDTSSTPPPTTAEVATTPPPSPPAAAPPPADGVSDAQAPDAVADAPEPTDTSAGTQGPNAGSADTQDPTGTTSTQDANIATNGTSVANTGANGAVATGPGTTPASNAGVADATVGTGTSNATGTNSASAIDQQAHASATDQGAVDILQIALVVNVGVASSNSGHNVVGAGAAGPAAAGSVAGTVESGNASAIGDSSTTGVKQSAVVSNGETTTQTAFVVNIGIGIGNSGLNITIGSINDNGNTVDASLVAAGHAQGSVTTGTASAIGDASTSKISQLAGGTASGTAVLTIDQRAIVVNFGTALANSGGNFAFASFDPSALTPEEAQIVQAVLSILAPFFAPPSQGTAGSLGNTIASVISGNASAVGNASNTTINQSVVGNVTGSGVASAHQVAEVGNFGLALANTGFNGALAGIPVGTPGAKAQLLAAQNGLLQFLSLLTNLDWLSSANPFAQFSQTIDLGGLTLNLGGSLEGDQFLLGWDSAYAPDGGPIPGGVRVRQISAVLNIGFSVSDTGDNTVVAIVAAANAGNGPSTLMKNTVATGSPQVLASVKTGSATAVGNLSDVMVCQAFHTSIVCRPPAPKPPVVVVKHETPPPPAPPVVTLAPPAEVVASPAPELPFTGGDAHTMLELAGALLAAGAAAASRRRRNQVV